MDTMKPWLHFTRGDTLLFESWVTSSSGSIAGACIGLAALAVIERWINASRGILEGKWRQSALVVATSSCNDSAEPQPDVCMTGKTVTQSQIQKRPPRTYPPFIPSHDIPRGAIFALQTLLEYILMLTVMTFQAAFIISIVFGLMIGEILFGRFSGSKALL